MFRTEEYEALRAAAALLETPTRARVRVEGRNRLDLLHRMTSQELKSLRPGEGRTAVLLTDKGRISDHLAVYALEEDLRLLSAREDASASLSHLKRYTIRDDFRPLEQTAATALLQIVGPRAPDVLEAAGVAAARGADGLAIRALGEEEYLLSTDGPGARNLALWVPASRAAEWRRRLLEAGRPLGLRQAGEEAYEVFRVERGWPAWGRELSEEVNPLEAGLNASIHWNKGCYIGQEVIARLDTYHKVQRHLVGLRIEAGAPPPPPGSVVLAAGQTVGSVTSAVISPLIGAAAALAYVRTAHAAPETELEVRSGESASRALVTALPLIA